MNAKKASSIFESLLPNRRTILNDKKLLWLLDSRDTASSQTSDPASIGNAKGSSPFWSKQCQEVSERLWLARETDCVVSPLSSSNGFFRKQGLDSLSSNHAISPQKKNSATTCFPLCKYSAAEKTEGEGTVIVVRKIKLKLSKEQKSKVNMFADHARYTYNQTIERINRDGKANKMKLRNDLVTSKNNPYFEDKEWLLQTPKVIRQQAVFEAAKNYKSALTNITRKHIRHFKLGFKSKKKKTWSLGIERAAKQRSAPDGKRHIAILPESVGACGYYGKLPFEGQVPADSTLQKDEQGRYFLAVPIKKEKKKNAGLDARPVIALDPGVRKFLTGFCSDDTAVILGEGFGKRLVTLLKTIDAVDAQIAKANSQTKRRLRKKKMRLFGKFKDLRDEFHWKTINYLTDQYSCIIVPHLETQRISQLQSRAKTANREMFAVSHYKFLQKLTHKCREKNVALLLVDEAFTTKTCTCCGKLTDIGASTTYRCSTCHFIADRDIQAARNILLKSTRVVSTPGELQGCLDLHISAYL